MDTGGYWMQFNEFAQKLSPNDIPKCLPITQTFQKYLNDASVYYSTKKTLLFAEKPCPFYDLYVCNKIRRNKLFELGESISGVTVEKLEQGLENLC